MLVRFAGLAFNAVTPTSSWDLESVFTMKENATPVAHYVVSQSSKANLCL